MSDGNDMVRIGDCLRIAGEPYMLASAGYDVAIIINLSRGTRWGGPFGIGKDGIRMADLITFANSEFETPYRVDRIGYAPAFADALRLRKQTPVAAF